MRQNNKSKLSLTIGISTKYGKESLLTSVRSVLASKNIEKFRLIVFADTVPLNKNLRRKLENLGAEVIEKRATSTLPYKLKAKLAMCNSDIILYTHDDIILDPNAISEILNIFEQDKKTTFVVARVVPVFANKFLETVINIGVKLVYRIGEAWNKQDNYLLANGRCMAFRTKHLKKFNIPDEVISIDVYLYLENKRLGGKFKYAKGAIINIKSADKLNEHMNQSSRFQYVPDEMSKYFGEKIKSEFKIPRLIFSKAIISEFMAKPFHLISYLILYSYSRLRKNKEALTPLWQVDKSTKLVNIKKL